MISIMRTTLVALIVVVGTPALAKPKYGMGVSLLRDDHGYLQTHPAPLYWALSPYYSAQRNDSSCSLAVAAMVVNAARTPTAMASDELLATQDGILAKVRDPGWAKGTAPGGDGVTLDALAGFLARALEAYGVKGAKIDVVHVPKIAPRATPADGARAALAAALAAGEQDSKAGRTIVVANFLDGVLTGDGDTGHFSPIGAYDAATRRVLVLDVDRAWYEPYWVSLDTLLQGMGTIDKDAGNTRGYLRIALPR
jgi:hypothetical protein